MRTRKDRDRKGGDRSAAEGSGPVPELPGDVSDASDRAAMDHALAGGKPNSPGAGGVRHSSGSSIGEGSSPMRPDPAGKRPD